ncbi:hypothetical protein ULMS_07960 [Patiriisocius marinistellae]|uniref:Uncharacterized protein n=1 Tax=Patiriisocius marinistellae TaxID=2494560 RepID=A0A5J4FVK8_9FLAO|nr:hypothetical protein [Patiriisocius marinistellae]GEQ85288.1 hypothetical protein ULMS_07960 [Patiriisocius marinistellae]
MKKTIILSILLVLLLIIPSQAQCAMCRAVLESEEGNTMAKGINNGIMYLMIFPYLLVGGIGYMIYRNRQKNKTSEES